MNNPRIEFHGTFGSLVSDTRVPSVNSTRAVCIDFAPVHSGDRMHAKLEGVTNPRPSYDGKKAG